MDSKTIDDFLDEIKSFINKKYGAPGMKYADENAIYEVALVFAKDREEKGYFENEEDFRYEVTDYFKNTVRPRIDFGLRHVVTDVDNASSQLSEVELPQSRGLLQDVVAYASVFPELLRARREVLGTTEPLPDHNRAIEWMKEEQTSAPLQGSVEVTFRFRIGVGNIPRVRDDQTPFGRRFTDLKPSEIIDDFSRAHIEGTGASWADGMALQPMTLVPDPRGTHITVPHPAGYQEVIRLEAGKLVCLGEWAAFISNLCGRSTTYAVSLILTGEWKGLPPYAEASLVPTYRSESLIKAHPMYQIPTLNLLRHDMNTPPEDLKRIGKYVRKEWGLGGLGRPLEKKVVVLGYAAIEVQHLENLYLAEKGYKGAVLARYKKIAPRHGINLENPQNKYSMDTLRHALKRLDSAFQAFELRRAPPEWTQIYEPVPPKSLFQRPQPKKPRKYQQWYDDLLKEGSEPKDS